MPTREFAPGFRFSVVDGIVLLIGAVAASAVWQTSRPMAFVIAFVVSHFFLFCNVFRVARSLELAWSALFIMLSASTINFSQPTWLVSIAISLLATVVVIGFTLRSPSYHGALWNRINPHLPAWCEQQRGTTPLR